MHFFKYKVFCPYCCSKLQFDNQELLCKKGHCYFSRNLTSLFLDSIKSNDISLDKTKKDSEENGYFFCIRCGTRMTKIDKMVEKCPKCGFEIDKHTYYQLVELTPHKRF
jgi:DNA-directed RNA polymerase subunit RPC12/RpoP